MTPSINLTRFHDFHDLFALENVSNHGIGTAEICRKTQEEIGTLLAQSDICEAIIKAMRQQQIGLLSYYGEDINRMDRVFEIRQPSEITDPTLLAMPADIEQAIALAIHENEHLKEFKEKFLRDNQQEELSGPDDVTEFFNTLALWRSGDNMSAIENHLQYAHILEWITPKPQMHLIDNDTVMHRTGTPFVQGKVMGQAMTWHRDGLNKHNFLLMLAQHTSGIVHRNWLAMNN